MLAGITKEPLQSDIPIQEGKNSFRFQSYPAERKEPDGLGLLARNACNNYPTPLIHGDNANLWEPIMNPNDLTEDQRRELFLDGLRGPDGTIAPFNPKCAVIGCDRIATHVRRHVVDIRRPDSRIPSFREIKGASFCEEHINADTHEVMGGGFIVYPEPD